MGSRAAEFAAGAGQRVGHGLGGNAEFPRRARHGLPMGAGHERAAFQWDAELSVYVAACAQQRGIGRALYTCLIAFLQEQGYSTLYALITVPNDNSERLHAKLGFERAALYPRTGYKFGQWRDMIVMEKRLSPPFAPPEPPHAFSTLPAAFVENVLREEAAKCNAKTEAGNPQR